MAEEQNVQYFNEATEKQFGFAAAVRHGDTLTLSGLISVNESFEIVAPGDVNGQINQIYDNLEVILARNGATVANVVHELIFVTDMAELIAGSETRKQRYEAFAPPAATAVQIAALFLPEAIIEIQATVDLSTV